MARIQSLNILLEQEGRDYLAELYGHVIDNIEKNLISGRMKNRDLSGDPTAGSVEAKRFANARPQQYGTARAAGKGNALKARPVPVVIDQDEEIVEEIEAKDIKLYGVDSLLERRARNHVLRMCALLDRVFFSTAYASAQAVETDPDAGIEDQLEAIIQACENTMNDFVDGVPRSMMHLICSTKTYGKIRSALDKVSRPNVDTTAEEFYAWHGVEAQSCVHLPVGCEYLLMVDGAVAQPAYANPYQPEKIQLSEAYAVSLFFHYGTAVVTPDLIFKPVFVSGAEDADSGTTSTASAKLSALTLGSLVLTPTFDADVTSYTATTTNATNTVTATAEDSEATVAIANGETTVANGSAATWASGENTLTITVTNGTATKTYTVTVTKT